MLFFCFQFELESTKSTVKSQEGLIQSQQDSMNSMKVILLCSNYLRVTNKINCSVYYINTILLTIHCFNFSIYNECQYQNYNYPSVYNLS